MHMRDPFLISTPVRMVSLITYRVYIGKVSRTVLPSIDTNYYYAYIDASSTKTLSILYYPLSHIYARADNLSSMSLETHSPFAPTPPPRARMLLNCSRSRAAVYILIFRPDNGR